jgi:hypothetical protein
MCVCDVCDLFTMQSNWVAIVQGCLCDITTTSTAAVKLDSVTLRLALVNIDYHDSAMTNTMNSAAAPAQTNSQVSN